MGHQQRRLALLPYDAVDIRRYGQPCLIVQRRKGLIQQQHLGLSRQRPDQGAPLAHPAGELGGPLLSEVRQPVALQQLPDMGLPLRRILAPYRQAQRHVAPDAAPLEQLVPLRHEPHLPGGAAHRFALQLHPAAGERLQPRQRRQQGGFSAAGGTHDAAKFPLLHIEGDIPQRLHLPVRGLVHEGGVQELYHHIRPPLPLGIAPGSENVSPPLSYAPGSGWVTGIVSLCRWAFRRQRLANMEASEKIDGNFTFLIKN